MIAIHSAAFSQRGRAAIGKAEEYQGVGKARDAEADAPLGAGFLRLCFERIAGNIDDVVEKANGRRDAGFELRMIDARRRGERLLDEPRQVIDPRSRRHTAAAACSPQGFVAEIVSQ